jgi:hypothetical protein
MRIKDSPRTKPTYWQAIFLQSKVNGASYNGEALARYSWNWPKGTYLQRRLREVKFLGPLERSKTTPGSSH